MLFLLFQVGSTRYALEASRVVEVLPLVQLAPLPNAPAAVAGVLNYRGQPVPALDLTRVTSDTAAAERLSTRILVIQHPDSLGRPRLLGLIAEHATGMLQTEPPAFVEPAVRLQQAPYLGPVLLDPKGPIHLLREQRLLSAPDRDLLFPSSVPV